MAHNSNITLKVDSTGVTRPPLITPQTRFALRQQQFANVRNNQLQLQANKAMSDLKQKAQVEKAVKKHYKQQSDQTRRTYNEPHVQQEQDRANLTPEQELRRDQPQPKPNMDVENAINQTIPYMIPYVGEALMFKDAYNGVKDIADNGLNWNNGIQTALSGIPLGVGAATRSLRIPKYVGDVERRGAESLMRTTIAPNPLPEAYKNISIMVNGELGRKRLASNVIYILSGKKYGPKGYYNSYAPYRTDGTIAANSGFIPLQGKYPQILDGKNDLIDAFMYTKTIDPAFGVKKVEPDYGVHSQYVKDNYPNKNIPVYEMTEMNGYAGNSPEVVSTGKTVSRGNIVASEIADDVTGHYSPNVGGHYVEEGYLHDGTQNIRMQDIWKFNPDEYGERWKYIYKQVPDDASLSEKVKAYLYNTVTKIGLHEVDRLGTPVVIRSKWIKPDYPWNFNVKQ